MPAVAHRIPLEVEIMTSLTDAVGVLQHIHRIASCRPMSKSRTVYTTEQRLKDIDVLAKECVDRVIETAKKLEEK